MPRLTEQMLWGRVRSDTGTRWTRVHEFAEALDQPLRVSKMWMTQETWEDLETWTKNRPDTP